MASVAIMVADALMSLALSWKALFSLQSTASAMETGSNNKSTQKIYLTVGGLWV